MEMVVAATSGEGLGGLPQASNNVESDRTVRRMRSSDEVGPTVPQIAVVVSAPAFVASRDGGCCGPRRCVLGALGHVRSACLIVRHRDGAHGLR